MKVIRLNREVGFSTISVRVNTEQEAAINRARALGKFVFVYTAATAKQLEKQLKHSRQEDVGYAPSPVTVLDNGLGVYAT